MPIIGVPGSGRTRTKTVDFARSGNRNPSPPGYHVWQTETLPEGDRQREDVEIRFKTFTAGLKKVQNPNQGFLGRHSIELGKTNAAGRTRYQVRTSEATETTAGFFFIGQHRIVLRQRVTAGQVGFDVRATCKAKAGPFKVRGANPAQIRDEFAPRIEYMLIFESRSQTFSLPLAFDSWSSSQMAVLPFDDYFQEKDYCLSQSLSPADLTFRTDTDGAAMQLTLEDLKAVQWGFAKRTNLPGERAFEFVDGNGNGPSQ